jgi:hypothetical protein
VLYRYPPAEAEHYVIGAIIRRVAVRRGPDESWVVQPGSITEAAHWY